MEFSVSALPRAQGLEHLSVHLAALPSRIDSFLEDHLLASAYYHVEFDRRPVGHAAIYDNHLLTHFSLDDDAKHHGQAIYRFLLDGDNANAAFVPTCDEFFLAHALDDYQTLTKQAYVFAVANESVIRNVPPDIGLRLAMTDDLPLIRRENADFLEHPETMIRMEQLFVVNRGNLPVGLGVMVCSQLYPKVASVGMFTFAANRNQGIGAATVYPAHPTVPSVRDRANRRVLVWESRFQENA